MITALDTSVILDVITDSPIFADSSERAIRQAGLEGKLVVCECAVAEILPALGTIESVKELLSDWQIEFSPLSLESSLIAGEMYSRYLLRRGSAKRVLADFLIGAHASEHADRLLARDRGYYRDYFDNLLLWIPS
ncbi:MAG: type II toxin-antitoxin system VapC family toxin [Spirochaetaceae bacterium]|nr:type II toxin-antitoxin system VapC family toxin [Spirochaetaceae bacterium]